MAEKKFIGSMLGAGIGDALGRSFEGSWRGQIQPKDIKFDGRWTDDTHMMIGVAESLIASKGFNAKHMLLTFMRNWEKEPWRGYGPGPPRVFRMIRSGVPWNEAAKRLYGGEGSFGNGAAMRIAPIGLLFYDDAERLREIACKSAELTHAHDLGKEGAAIQAYAVALAVRMEKDSFDPGFFIEKIMEFTRNDIYKEKLERAKALLARGRESDVIRKLGNSVEALNSVPTAIFCFAKNPEEYAKAVLYAVKLGGDTDTIAAMSGAIAGAYHGEEGILESWRRKLEKGDYIKNLARELWRLKQFFMKEKKG